MKYYKDVLGPTNQEENFVKNYNKMVQSHYEGMNQRNKIKVIKEKCEKNSRIWIQVLESFGVNNMITQFYGKKNQTQKTDNDERS